VPVIELVGKSSRRPRALAGGPERREVELAEELRETVAMLVMVEPGEIGLDTSFAELGVDSLSRLELIALVEQHLGTILPEDQIPEVDNINEVVQFAEASATV
jgi:acyl carrier protein